MDHPERRKHPRFTLSLPVEVYAEGSDTPIRFATSDLSLDGCYVETMFPFPVGIRVDLKLQLGESTVLIVGKVVTSHTQVGNGIEFVQSLPEDLQELRAFLDSVASQQASEKAKDP